MSLTFRQSTMPTYRVERVIQGKHGPRRKLLVGHVVVDDFGHGLLTLHVPVGREELRVTLDADPDAEVTVSAWRPRVR